MRIAVVQLAYDDHESPGARVARASDLTASLRGHDLAVLPELWMPTGFGYAAWSALAEPLDGPWTASMADAARAFGGVLHAGSFVERLAAPGAEGRVLANTSVVFSADGERLAVYRKIHRFGFGSGEPVLMEAGDEVVTVAVPAGSGSVTVGLSTCYDLRFPELYRRLLDAGSQLFVVPAAWPLARVEHWRLLGRARAVENQCVMVQCNTGGTHAGTTMGGRSQVVLPIGEVVAEAPDNGEHVLSIDVDLTVVDASRDAFPVLRDRRL